MMTTVSGHHGNCGTNWKPETSFQRICITNAQVIFSRAAVMCEGLNLFAREGALVRNQKKDTLTRLTRLTRVRLMNGEPCGVKTNQISRDIHGIKDATCGLSGKKS